MPTQYNGTPGVRRHAAGASRGRSSRRTRSPASPQCRSRRPSPPAAESVLIDPANGLRATSSCSRARTEVIAIDKVPSAYSHCSATVVADARPLRHVPGERAAADRSQRPRPEGRHGPALRQARRSATSSARAPAPPRRPRSARWCTSTSRARVLHVTVPKVIGKSEAQARSALCVAGLKVTVEHSDLLGKKGAGRAAEPARADGGAARLERHARGGLRRAQGRGELA